LRILESLVVRVSVVPEISVDRQCAASNTATGGVLDEVVEDLQESGWIVVDGKWPLPRKTSRRGAGHRGMREMGVTDGDDGVPIAPDDLHEYVRGHGTAVKDGDDLPTPINHRARRVRTKVSGAVGSSRSLNTRTRSVLSCTTVAARSGPR